jgi:hypothetical protein
MERFQRAETRPAEGIVMHNRKIFGHIVSHVINMASP